MNIPVILPDVKVQRYACRGCTKCCRELVVDITEADRRKIDARKWAGKLGAAPYVRKGRRCMLNHTPDGGCVFLLADGKCRIHAEHGLREKPLACRLYPFTLESDGKRMRAGIRFDCPSVAHNKGEPLPNHKSEVTELATALKEELPHTFTAATAYIDITPGRGLPAEMVDDLVEKLDAWLRNGTMPFLDRMLGLSDWLGVLRQAKLGRIQDEQLVELLDMLLTDMPNAVESLRAKPIDAPTFRQLKLFRQAIFAHCEHITFHQSQASFLSGIRYRFGQLRRAGQLGNGDGPIPQLIQGLSGGTFDRLDAVQPQCNLDADARDELLTRYVRLRLLSRNAFGKGYHDLSVLEGLASLVVAMAAVGWLTRYVAVAEGRGDFTQDDIVRALGVVDRSAGRAAELGTRPARLRLSYLLSEQGLIRLMCAYPIVPE